LSSCNPNQRAKKKEAISVAGIFIRKSREKRPALPPVVEDALAELARLTDQRPNLAELAMQLNACIRAPDPRMCRSFCRGIEMKKKPWATRALFFCRRIEIWQELPPSHALTCVTPPDLGIAGSLYRIKIATV
jgi:hypothetical protein